MDIIRFCFTHKTASMFGHKVLAAVSQAKGLPYFSPNNKPPNHTDVGAHISAASDQTLLFGPSRNYAMSPVFAHALEDGHALYDICQIRNPLDILVSQYFSHGWIHPDKNWSKDAIDQRRRLQSGTLSMSEYAQLELLGEISFAGFSITEKFRDLEIEVPRLNRRIMRYEQFYNDYDSWAAEIADFLPAELDLLPLMLEMRPSYDRAVVLEDDVFYANPLEYVEAFEIGRGKHIRSAAPGDYTHFLTPEEAREISAEIAASCPTVMSHYSDTIAKTAEGA